MRRSELIHIISESIKRQLLNESASDKAALKYLETQGEGSTNQTELKPVTIASLALPLPPLEEQKRIVAKIEELLPYCDQLLK